jgi:hypothetical protein
MPLNVNGYNNAFSAFVEFANANGAENGKAVARFAATETMQLGVARKIVAADPQVDRVGKSRDLDQKRLNDSVRTAFRNAIRDMFGGEAKIPANVKKAMLLKDFDEGKPLTARRILAVKAAIDSHLSAVPDKIDVEVRGRTVTFGKAYYERMVEAMPAEERPRGLNGRTELAAMLKGILSARIDQGLTILANVREGNGAEHPATAANVADLSLALYAIAAMNGEGFINGAFSVADPKGRLAKWLDTSNELYLRRSSHLEAYQGMTVDGHRNVMRGIDVAEGRYGLLGGMKTVHFGTIPDLHSSTGDGCGPQRRLFFKCESHGIYYNPFFNHSRAAGKTPGMRERTSRNGDFIEFWKHTFSFLETRGQDPTAGGARKEHMTANVKEALDRAVTELKAAGRGDLAAILSGNKAEKGGAKMVLDNVMKAHAADPDNPLIQRIVNDIVQTIVSEHAGKHGDSIARLGNEVMIEDSDIAALV